MAKKFNRGLKLGYDLKVINGVTIKVSQWINIDGIDYIQEGFVSGAPTNLASQPGIAKGGFIINATAASGSKAVYENVGTTASATLNLIGDVTAGEITLARGNVLVGNSSGVATALDANDSGKILVGDGTDLASVAVSGDATLASNGALTIANSAVTSAKMATAAKTQSVVVPVSPLPALTGANQTDVDRFLWRAPAACTISAIRLISSATTSGSDATNHYEFNVRNATAGNNLGAANTSTVSNELTAESPKTITADQNLTLAAGDGLNFRTQILDDGGAGPTGLNTAALKVLIDYVTG